MPNGSAVVFAIANPVSKPDWLVTYGYSKTVRHPFILNQALAADASGMNRGMVKVLDAAAAAPDVNVGAKLRLTVAEPRPGVVYVR